MTSALASLRLLAMISMTVLPLSGEAFPTDLDYQPEGVYRYRPDGKPGLEISLLMKGGKLTEGGKVTIAWKGREESFTVPAQSAGLERLTVLLPEGAGVRENAKIAATVQSGDKKISKAFTVPAQRQWTVFLYPHSHVDIGYTQPQDIVEKITARNLRTGMDIARAASDKPAGAKYVWNPEVVWPVENFLKVASPDEKMSFVKAVKDGGIGLDMSFAHLDTSVCDDEELFHYFDGGLALRRMTGAPVDTMVQMDVPGMSWGVATVAAQTGIKGVIDFPNGYDRIGDIHHHYEQPFWWVSPDGKSRLLYIQGPQYDLGWSWKAESVRPKPYPKFDAPAPSWVQDWPAVTDRVRTANPSAHFIPLSYIEKQTRALETKGLPYDYLTMTWSMSDNSIPDADLPDAVEQWNKTYAYPRLEIASAHRIVSAYIEKFGSIIPERRGDLTEYWTDGLGSDALRTGYNRKSKERLVQAEVLHSMLKGTDGAEAFNSATSEAWRFVTLGSEHTWGYFKPEHPLAKKVEAVKAGYFEAAKTQSEKIIADTLATATRPGGGTVRVFNTLSWTRTGVATLPAGVAGVADAAGSAVPVQKLSGGETVFLAKDVPALGERAWKVAQASTAAPSPFVIGPTSLENDQVRVDVDPGTGDVTHLVDKKTGHDFVDAKSPYAINSFRYLKGSDAAKNALAPSNVKVVAGENGPVLASLKIESSAPGCNKLVREVRLTAGSAQVEFLDSVDKISTRQKEGVHFGFAFNVPEGRIRMDIPWGVMTPEDDQMPGANKNWLAYQHWIDISNGERGVTWGGVEAPIVEIGDITANLLGGVHDLRQWRKNIASTQTLFSWALNNHWHTNFPLEQGGVIPFRYAVLPHGAYDPVIANRFGLELNRPLLAVESAPAPMTKPPLALDNPRVFVSTLKPIRGGAYLLRLRSLSDKAEKVTLSFPGAAPKELRTSGGDEVPGAAAEATQVLPPFGCLSLWVKW